MLTATLVRIRLLYLAIVRQDAVGILLADAPLVGQVTLCVRANPVSLAQSGVLLRMAHLQL